MKVRKIYYLLSVSLGVLIAVIVAVLFDIYINSDSNTDIANFQLSKNKVLLYTMKSGENNWYYKTKININKQGFRDVDFDKKNGNIKIMCLGDSTTFGGDVNENFLYTNQLSKLLGENYSVYNLGIDGYNIIQEAENLKVNGLKYKPTVVLVIFCLNDFEDKDSCYIYYAAKANYYTANAFLCKSKMYRRFVYLPVIKLIDKLRNKNITSPANMYRNYGEINVSDINDKEIGVKIISELQKQYNFKCYFFILPYFRNFDNYLEEDENIHSEVKKILRKYTNIKFFDLKEYFMNVSKNCETFKCNDWDFIHPNKYAHKLIAEFIYEKLKSDGALKDE